MSSEGDRSFEASGKERSLQIKKEHHQRCKKLAFEGLWYLAAKKDSAGESQRQTSGKGFLLFLGSLGCNPKQLSSTKARFKRADELTVESMKARQSQPDIPIIEKKTVASPLWPYTPRAIEGPVEIMSTMLSYLQPPNEMQQNLLVWQRKIWAPDRTEKIPFKKRRTMFILSKPRSEEGQGGISRELHRRNSWRKLWGGLKRSLSSRHEAKNNLEEQFGSHNPITQARKRRESKAKFLRKRRDAEITITPNSSNHLQLSALKTQMKLSEIVEQLANPTTHLTEAEKLAYMRELLQELKLFIKLLQQQMDVQSKGIAQSLARASALPSEKAS